MCAVAPCRRVNHCCNRATCERTRRAAPSWKVADPLCTFLFSILVLFTTWPVFKRAVRMLLNVMPDTVNLASMHADLVSVEVRGASASERQRVLGLTHLREGVRGLCAFRRMSWASTTSTCGWCQARRYVHGCDATACARPPR